MCEQSVFGRRLFDCFVKERVRSGEVNLWSPRSKRKLLTWKAGAKVVKVAAGDKIGEPQEDIRSLFLHMMMVCKSRPELDKGNCPPTRMFGSPAIIVCCWWYNASLFIQEYQD